MKSNDDCAEIDVKIAATLSALKKGEFPRSEWETKVMEVVVNNKKYNAQYIHAKVTRQPGKTGNVSQYCCRLCGEFVNKDLARLKRHVESDRHFGAGWYVFCMCYVRVWYLFRTCFGCTSFRVVGLVSAVKRFKIRRLCLAIAKVVC